MRASFPPAFMNPRGLHIDSLNRAPQLERLEDRRLMALDTVAPVQEEVRMEATTLLQRGSDPRSNDAYFAALDDEELAEGESNEIVRTAAALNGFRASRDTMTYSAEFSPSGEYFATGTREVTVFRTATGDVVRTFNGHDNLVMSTVFVSETEILSVSYDGTARLENIETGETVQTWGIGGLGVDVVVYNRKVLIDVTERQSKLIDLDTGYVKNVSPGRYHRFVPGTDYIVYTSEDGRQLWREHLINGGKVKLADLMENGEAYDLAVSASGKSAAVVGMHGMVIHVDLETGTVTPLSTEGIAAHGVTFAGEKMITTNGSGKVFVRAIVNGEPKILEEISFGTFVDVPRLLPGTNELVVVKTSDASESRLVVTTLQSIDPTEDNVVSASAGGKKSAQDELTKASKSLQEADLLLQQKMGIHTDTVAAYESAKGAITALEETVAVGGGKTKRHAHDA